MRVEIDDLGPPELPPHAGDLFTDRESESVSFRRALDIHRARLDDPEATGHLNVLVYYGVGGIGKSTLSERLESWARDKLPLGHGWGRRPDAKVAATARIDLQTSAGRFDVLSAVMSIRFALGRLKRRWPSFDIAFTAYWQASHPGEPLPENDREAFGDIAGEVMTNLASDLGIAATPVALGIRGTRALVREFRVHQARSTLSSIPNFVDLLDKCANLPSKTDPHEELIGKLAEVLAFELSQWDSEPVPLIVVFVDTLERLTLDPRRLGERRLNQLVWSLPNVLFVLTGRNVLDWSQTTRTDLFRAGPANWPGLVLSATDEPRQHLVGKLSMDDRLRVIRRGRSMFDLEFSEEVAQQLAITSNGLPQYLDLARAVAVSIKQSFGRAVTVDDVTGSLGQLVMRVFEDIPPDEQRAIRAAALFSYFDIEIVAATAGVDHGCVERAMRRPMIDRWPGSEYPYRMHDEIRHAILHADFDVTGGWSTSDWEAAGTLGLRAARQRYDRESKDDDGSGSLQALGLAIEIVCALNVPVEPAQPTGSAYADWLTKAVVHGPSITALHRYIPAVSATTYGQHVLNFIQGKAHELEVSQRCALLRDVFESDHPLAGSAGRHLAYTLRAAVQWDAALAAFVEVMDRFPSTLNRYQYVTTLIMARRFRTAREVGERIIPERRRALDLNIGLAAGFLREYVEEREIVVDRLWNSHRRREWFEENGAYLRWSALLDGRITWDEVELFQQRVEDIGSDLGLREALTAKLFLQPQLAQAGSDVHDQLIFLDRAWNAGNYGMRSAQALITSSWALGDFARVEAVRDEITAQSQPRSRMWIPVECLLDKLGLALPPQDTEWPEAYDLIRDRWWEILQRWRARVTR